jgi:acyl transferase domain-containing protein/phosphopantetheinyl transferase
MSGLIANRLDLRGPNFVVDAACASALIALQMGMQDLLTGKCDAVLTGGVQISTSVFIHMIFTQLGALSRLPQLRPFDKNADGTMLSEGVGMIVLKRKADAERDGHRIYAVIKGVGSSSDGRAKGILTPRTEGEELALRRAYEASDVNPATVGLIEAHGTGLPVGDAAEIEAIKRVFDLRDDGSFRCAIGTVKSMIGHLIPAAGIAGIIKTAMALYHKVLPPTLHCDTPNPRFQLEKTKLYINTEARPWVHGLKQTPRRAGVNAFGFGGINAHAVIEEYRPAAGADVAIYHSSWDSELCIFQGKSRQELIQQCEIVLVYLAQATQTALVDIAYTLNRNIGAQPYCLSIVAASPDDLSKKLEHAIKRLRDPERQRIRDRSGIYFFESPLGRNAKLAFLFPGEGSQYVNMLADICLHFPEAHACFDLLDQAYAEAASDYLPSDFIFPPTDKAQAEAEAKIFMMDGAVDAVTTANRALFKILTLLGVKPDTVLGHSSGEFMALEAAGAIQLSGEEELIKHIRAGNRMIKSLRGGNKIAEGALLAVGGVSLEQVSQVINKSGGALNLAMDNCPHQFVLYVQKASTAQAMSTLRKLGGICRWLSFDRAYHTSLFEPVLESLQIFFDNLNIVAPQIPIYSCMTAGPFPREPREIRRMAVRQWAEQVRFREAIENMYKQNVRIFVEIGPRGNLTGFTNDILKGKRFLAIPSNVHHKTGITQLNHLLGLLAASGVGMHPEIIYKRRMARKLDFKNVRSTTDDRNGRKKELVLELSLPTLSIDDEIKRDLHHLRATEDFSHKTEKSKIEPMSADSMIQRESASDLNPFRVGAEDPEPDAKVLKQPDPADSRHLDSHDAVMLEYLRTQERILDAQHQTMQAYLKAGTANALEPAHGDAGHDRVMSNLSVPTAPPTPAAADVAEPSADMDISPSPTDHDGKTKVPGRSSQAVGRQRLEQILLETVSAKTGYPVDTIDVNHSLEADLGIDSIKRTEILGSLLQQIEMSETLADESASEHLNTLKTSREIVEFLADHINTESVSTAQTPAGTSSRMPAVPDQPSPARPSAYPLIDRIEQRVAGKGITAFRTIDREEDLFVKHHTLGGDVSRYDQTLTALPVVPFTMGLEIMAEAAAELAPGLALIGMKRIQAHRWIFLEEPSLTLKINASIKSTDVQEIDVQVHVRNVAEPGSEYSLAMQATMIFAETQPEIPEQAQFQIEDEGSPPLSRDQFYPGALFHGPLFQTVESLTRYGSNGAVGVLNGAARAAFFKDNENPDFLSAPLLIDGAGQIVGLWAGCYLDENFVVFPISIEEIRLHAPLKPSLSQVQCRVHTGLVGDEYIRSDIQLLSEDDALWIHIKGMQHKRIQMPEIFHLFRGSRKVMLSSQWPVASEHGHDREILKCCRLDGFSKDFWETDGGIWPKMVAQIVLSRRERKIWQGFAVDDLSQRTWLSHRIVGKEAVRMALKASAGMDIWPADIDILEDEQGRLRVSGKWTDQLKAAPSLAVAHTESMALALSLAAEGSPDVGISAAHLSDLSVGHLKPDLLSKENDLISQRFSADAAEWLLRLWCAKKALSRALGQAPLNELVAFHIDPDVGSIEFKIPATGSHGQDLKDLKWVSYTHRHKDIITAHAVCHTGIRRKPRAGNNSTGSSNVARAEINSQPFIDEITELESGERLTALRHFDLNEDIFLQDHALGKDISVTDEDLTGLPILPLTISMEMMAEAASLLQPDDLLIGMRDIRAYRWIGFDEGKLTLQIDARRISPAEIEVKIWDSDGASGPIGPVGMPVIEGRMLFGRKYPDPPPAEEFKLTQKQLSLWPPNKLYSEGMFHGPRFQAVASMDSIAANGAEGTIRTLPVNTFFSTRKVPHFVTDPIVLDAAGQLLAYWFAQQHPEIGFNTYPYLIKALHIYGSSLCIPEQAKGYVKINADTENHIRADIDILDQDNRLRFQLIGWEDKPFKVPKAFYQLRFRPKDIILSSTWPEAVPGVGSNAILKYCRMNDYADNFLQAHGKIWLRVLAHLALSRRERELWRKQRQSLKQGVDWLLARIAGKDAVRLYIKDKYSLDLCLPDIEVEEDGHGHPIVKGSWAQKIGEVPSVSLANSNGTGAAIASERSIGCGIHLANLDTAADTIEHMYLSPEERDRLKSLQLAQNIEWLLRLWSAKQAMAKALGSVLSDQPEDFKLRALDKQTGRVELSISEKQLEEVAQFTQSPLAVQTFSHGDLIVAIAHLADEKLAIEPQ